MMPRVETIKIEKIKIPTKTIQIELSLSEFWRILDRLHLTVYEDLETFYMIQGRGDIVFFAKRRDSTEDP